MNPTAPNLHATIKLHKHNTPLRPITNWKNAPAYELAKHIKTLLHNHINVQNVCNIQNSIHLITELKTIEINEDTRMCSFDIKDIYTNIPKVEVINIIKTVTKNNLSTLEKKE
jgi:hypothetical protein